MARFMLSYSRMFKKKKKRKMTRNLGKTFIIIYKHSCESPMKGDTPSNIIFKCFRIHTGNIRCIDLYSTVQGRFAFLWLLTI